METWLCYFFPFRLGEGGHAPPHCTCSELVSVVSAPFILCALEGYQVLVGQMLRLLI